MNQNNITYALLIYICCIQLLFNITDSTGVFVVTIR